MWGVARVSYPGLLVVGDGRYLPAAALASQVRTPAEGPVRVGVETCPMLLRQPGGGYG